MNKLHINDFFLNEKEITFLNNWINKDYKKHFLFINGKDSCGKTSLAECILKSYKVIHINIDFFNKNDLFCIKKVCTFHSKEIDTIWGTIPTQ